MKTQIEQDGLHLVFENDRDLLALQVILKEIKATVERFMEGSPPQDHLLLRLAKYEAFLELLSTDEIINWFLDFGR